MSRARLAYAAFVLVAAAGYFAFPVDHGIFYPAVSVAAAVATVYAARRERGRAAVAWYLLAATFALWAAADTYYTWLSQGDAAPPFPSPSDALYLLGYPLAGAAVVLLTRRPLTTLRRSPGDLIELSLFVIGTGLVLWELVLEPSDAGGLRELVAVSYPSLDAVIATALVYGFVYAEPHRRRLLVLAAGWSVCAVADIAYAREVLVTSYVPGAAADSLWLATYGLFGIAALSGPEVDIAPTPPRLSARARTAVLLVSMLAPLLLLALRPEDLPVEVAAVAMLILVIVRLSALLNDNERLAGASARTASLLRATLDATEDAILVTDLRMRPVLYNRQFTDLWNVPAGLMEQESPSRLLAHVTSLAANPRHVASTTKALYADAGKSAVDEIRLVDGRTIRRSSRPQILGDEAVGRVCSFRDVTLERSAEQALRASTQGLRETLHKAHLLAVTLDADLRITYCNGHFLELTGWKRRQLLGRHWMDAMLPDADAVAIAEAAHKRHETEQVDYHLNDIVTRSGERRRIAWNSTSGHGLSGELEAITLIGFDMTPLLEAEEEIRRRERRMRALLENSLELVAVVDAEGRLVDRISADPAGVGPEPGGGARTAIFDRLHPEDAAAARELHRLALASPGESVPFELRVLDAEGRVSVLNGSVTNLLDDPDVGGIVVNSRDVTRTRKAEEELRSSREQLLHAQKLEAVARLAGGVAHDFNNLLTAIRGYTELMLMNLGPDDPVRHDAEEIGAAAERAAALTRQLLAFSRRQVMQPVVLDLNEVVEEMESLLRRLIGEDVTLVAELSPDLVPVRVDPSQLEQVLANLVVNARDAMPDGGTVEIRTENAVLPAGVDGLEPGTYVSLRVSDTGCGMDAETVAHVFEPFFTTKPLGAGTGLGLATVHGIVAQSGGAVRIASLPGEGTQIEVLLPHAQGQPAVAERAEPRPPDGKETILLVEDEALVRDLAHRVLAGRGYEVLAVAESPDAVELCSSHCGRIDLLLTDVVMPRMNGRELAERARRIRPDLQVLFMSGYTGHEVLAGAHDEEPAFLQKPFTPDVLARRVRQVLDTA